MFAPMDSAGHYRDWPMVRSARYDWLEISDILNAARILSLPVESRAWFAEPRINLFFVQIVEPESH